MIVSRGTSGRLLLSILLMAMFLGFSLLAISMLSNLMGLAFAQGISSNEREVKTKPSKVDNDYVWSLDFRFKDPRLIKVRIPGRGTRICWYMWYQVINRTGKPRTFIPDFELVTQDFPGSYHDEVLPSVHEAIKKIEDPTGYQDIKNSVTIASKPIPPTKKEDAFPRAITGVAIWDGSSGNPAKDPKIKDLSDTTRFSIFVSGLSNGWVLVDPIAEGINKEPIVRRKTLQLNFRKIGDRFDIRSREITFVSPAEWVYRAARLRVPGLTTKKADNPDKK